jgi:hypothetical protein
MRILSSLFTVFRTLRNTSLLVFLLAFPVLNQNQSQAGAYAQPSEYDVKAAFLLNFIKFIEWPSRPGESPATPFSICIFGDDPFGPNLEQIVVGETLNGRRLIVERIDRVQPSCRILFVGEFVRDPAKIIAAAGPGVLTVGEGERFIRNGGMIGFVVVNRRVRFDINHRAAVRASLQISARLLGVARSVVK